MAPFPGFPDRVRYLALPAVFFSEVLPRIADPAELKVTLHALPILLAKKGAPRYVFPSELLADRMVATSLRVLGEPGRVLEAGLRAAAARGVLVRVARPEGDLYVLNTPRDRAAIASLGNVQPPPAPDPPPPEGPAIFALYEQNIGLLTPLIAEQLADAARSYPPGWIEDAFREAVGRNRRNWRYIARILERWATEGRGDGATGRDPQEPEDRDKYLRGRYGRFVQR
jgi:DnaD/phage-associated family protein